MYIYILGIDNCLHAFHDKQNLKTNIRVLVLLVCFSFSSFFAITLLPLFWHIYTSLIINNI